MKYTSVLFAIAALVLGACGSTGPSAPTPPPPTPLPAATPTPEPMPEPTPEPHVLPPEPEVVPVDAVEIPTADGDVSIRVVRSGGNPLQFHYLDGTRWGHYGDQDALIGTDYTIELANTTSSRVKVVVGVDGLNIYRRKELAGNPTDDIGSILSPGARRTLPGWQVASDRAERFVFSPADWSDAAGIRDAEVGTILVEVYFEEGSKAAAGQKSKLGKRLGTTSGDAVDNRVGTVKFVPATSIPAASVLLVYGGTVEGAGEKRAPTGAGPGFSDSQTGLRVDRVPPGSSADRAGLEAGDVILRADSLRQPSRADFERLLAGKRSGDTIFLEVNRDGQKMRLRLKK